MKQCPFNDEILNLKKVTNPTSFFGFKLILGPFLGFKWVRLALRIQNGSDQVGVEIKKGSNLGSTL